ncbi:MAG: response regulator [Chitinispirillaceae bacterium]
MGYTVMIIDDSEIIRSVLKRAVDLSGLPVSEIITATDGVDGLEKLEENWVDIVFTDINMPRMNGIELFDRMLERKDLKNIPVVVVSTEGSSLRIDELRSKGIKGYLRKPCTPESVRDVIVNVLGEWK